LEAGEESPKGSPQGRRGAQVKHSGPYLRCMLDKLREGEICQIEKIE
jgi:hypothetical protein